MTPPNPADRADPAHPRGARSAAAGIIVAVVVLTVGLLSAPVTASGLPRHRVDASYTRVTNHAFVVHGKVTLRDHRFQVLERRAHTAKYVPLERPRAGGHGHFRFTVTGDEGDCFRIRFPGTSRHRETFVSLGCVHRIS